MTPTNDARDWRDDIATKTLEQPGAAASTAEQRESWQKAAAAKAKLPASFASRLTGATQDDIEADAAALALELGIRTVDALDVADFVERFAN